MARKAAVVEVTSNGGRDFATLAARLRTAGRGGALVRKATTKAIRGELQPTARDVSQAVLAVQSRGIHGGGTRRRQQFFDAHHKRASRKPHSLRQSISRLVRIKISYSGFKLGARLYVDGPKLPRSQRNLPRFLDGQGRWRHPVFGHRDRWVAQTGHEYFFVTINRHLDRMKRGVATAVTRALKELQR